MYITLRFSFSKVQSDQLFPIFSKPTLMDPTQIKKIQAMNRYKRRQFLDNLYFYSFTALTCILFCSVPLLLPYLSSLATDFFFVCIPSFVSVLFSSKFLFILGNLIIVVLIVNSRVFSPSKSSSSTTDVCYDEYMKSRVSKQTQRPQLSTFEVIDARKMEKHVAEYVDMRGEDVEKENIDEEEEGGPSSVSDSDELNRRADAFIARVNKQRKLELSLLQCGSY